LVDVIVEHIPSPIEGASNKVGSIVLLKGIVALFLYGV